MDIDSLIQLSQTDLERRKNSISKQSLIDALIRVKEINKVDILQDAETASDVIVQIVSDKINGILSPIIEKLNTAINKCDRLVSLYHELKTEHDSLKAEMSSKSDEITSEVTDRLSRRENLVFHGISEYNSGGSIADRESHDLKQLEYIASLIDVQDFSPVSLKRIGKPNKNGSRLLLVKCRSADEKWSILRKSKLLRSHESTKRIFVNPDLTKAQQNQEKALRNELKEKNKNSNDFLIRNGKIIHRSSMQKNFQ